MLSQNSRTEAHSQPNFRQLLAERAEEFFRQGHNCCESIIRASIETLKLPLPQETYLMGRFFRQGAAESGCICGALAGGLMILGYLEGREKYRVNRAQWLREQFTRQFGSTCCRVIRRQQTLAGRIRNRECRQITGFVAGLLAELAFPGGGGQSGG